MRQEQTLQLPTVAVHQNRRGYATTKRLLDLCVAVPALVIMSPIMLVVAVLVRLSSPGPVLFRQTRLGQGGQEFTFYKFRTMYDRADTEVHRIYVQALIKAQTQPGDEQSEPSNSADFKLSRDPRITPIGRLLRRTSLDELPQLMNVIKGDMSLVGPRPALPYEVEAYAEWHTLRLAALPGITGPWQVMGRSRVPFDEMVRMDLDYIDRQSILLDIKMLILTIPAVLSCNGAK